MYIGVDVCVLHPEYNTLQAAEATQARGSHSGPMQLIFAMTLKIFKEYFHSPPMAEWGSVAKLAQMSNENICAGGKKQNLSD